VGSIDLDVVPASRPASLRNVILARFVFDVDGGGRVRLRWTSAVAAPRLPVSCARVVDELDAPARRSVLDDTAVADGRTMWR
jgi:hypothetical protein